MPKAKTSPGDIVRIVGADVESYRTFNHMLVAGEVVLVEDYGRIGARDLATRYDKVECPKTSGTFSPDKYLSEHEGSLPQNKDAAP